MTLDRCDIALLAALIVAAALGTWTSCLLVNDGGVFLSAPWLGNTWELYFSQDADRTVSMLLTYGPAWIARRALGLSSTAFITLAHLLYFALPLVLWLVLRALETQRLFSRLYLAIVLPILYFPTELIAGLGLWMIWMALVVNPARSNRQLGVATVLFAIGLAFTHPSIALMSILYLVVGGVLVALGRPLPRRTLVAAAAMSIFLLAAYFGTSRWLPATNPTVLAALAANRYDFIDPVWMLATMALFPALAALWLLLLMPWSPPPRWAILIVAALGLWFAAAGTGLLTWMYARHTAAYILALALALALVSPSVWLARAQQPLILYAAIAAVAALSYNVDLFLFGRFVDRHAAPGVIDVDKLQPLPWPPQYRGPAGARIYFKWGAGEDYVRDVVVPTYDWHRVTLAFYSYFRSNRQSVLFHKLGRPGEWLPFHCRAVTRTQALPHDPQDQMFLTFLRDHYCVP